MTLVENGVQLYLTVVDTPGFGDSVNNDKCWEPIQEFIDQQFDNYLNQGKLFLNFNNVRCYRALKILAIPYCISFLNSCTIKTVSEIVKNRKPLYCKPLLNIFGRKVGQKFLILCVKSEKSFFKARKKLC